MRKSIIAANWKMNKTPAEAQAFFADWREASSSPCEIVFFPPTVSWQPVAQSAQKTGFHWGLQNAHPAESGAYTGEISLGMVKAVGANYVLVGHSERRQMFGDTDEFVAKKVAAAQKNGITPMLCVGETLPEREQGRAKAVVGQQLKQGLALADFNRPLSLAYEPVWAIGTGKVASPAQAEEMHEFLRRQLTELGGEKFAATPILYGGSVKPDNAGELAQQKNIDGFLVGGASLEASSFSAIVKAWKK